MALSGGAGQRLSGTAVVPDFFLNQFLKPAAIVVGRTCQGRAFLKEFVCGYSFTHT
jgi:predicted patatin/cPLA2 family phospholipase